MQNRPGTNNHTYPSKNGKDEKMVGKRMDVRERVPTENPRWGSGAWVWSTTNWMSDNREHTIW